MASSEFKTIGAVLQEFQVRYTEDNFVESLAFPVSDYFRGGYQRKAGRRGAPRPAVPLNLSRFKRIPFEGI